MKKIAILQSNYIPWIGYFDILNSVDEFIIYDSVQYTKNDWRNRNRIKTANGTIWLTIPVDTSKSHRQSIKETKISSSNWTKKHWKSLESNLNKTKYFEKYRDEWFRLYESAKDLEYIHDVNLLFLRALCGDLEITTRIIDDATLEFSGDSPTAKLVAICENREADRYLTGPSALNYLDVDLFIEKGIKIEIIDYSRYQKHRQLFGNFESNLSVLDLLANEGLNAKNYLLNMSKALNK
jgi:hypothetical protein